MEMRVIGYCHCDELSAFKVHKRNACGMSHRLKSESISFSMLRLLRKLAVTNINVGVNIGPRLTGK